MRNRSTLVSPRRLSLHLIGRSVSTQAYYELMHGHGGNPTAPLAACGDFDPTHDDVADGDLRGQHGREPLLVRAANGDILMFYKARGTDNSTNGDKAGYAVLMYRSTDNGASWEPPLVVAYAEYDGSGFTTQTRTHGVWVNPATGRIHLLFIRFVNAGSTTSDWNVYHSYSDDHGATWSAEAEITDDVSPASGAAPFDVTGAAGWGWYVFWCHGVTGQDGRGIMICYHRTTADNSGTAYTHAIVCTDDENWALAGGPLESNAANEATIEPHGALRSDGQIFVIAHNKLNSKAMATLAPATAEGTWQDYALQDGSGLSVDGATTSTNLQGVGCPYGIAARSGKLYLQAPCDSSTSRTHLKVWQSSNGGVSWTVSRILHRNSAGYSDLLDVDAGSFISVYEGTKATLVADTDAASGSGNAFYNEQIMVSRWPLTWLTQPENHLDYSHWVFNEASSGAIPTEGRPIKDRGTLQSHAYGGPAGTFTADGIEGDGTGIAVKLCDKVRSTGLSFPASANGMPIDPHDGSLTIEVVDLNISTSSAGAVFLSSMSGGSGAGIKISRSFTSGALSLTFGDGTTTKSLTTTTVWGTGVTATLRIEYDRGTNELRAYQDGVACYSAATDITGHGNIVSGGLQLCLGGNDNGTGTEAAFTCGPIRITRGIRTDFLTGDEERQSLINFYGGYTSPATFNPITDLTGLKMWVGRTDDGSFGARHDYYGGFDTHEIPAKTGRSFRSFIDPVLGQQWDPSQSYLSGWHLVEDDFVGKHYVVRDSGNGPYITRARLTAAGSLLDFPQETGEFLWFGCVKRRVYTSVVVLFDSSNWEAGAGAKFLLPTTNSQISVHLLKNGPTSVIGSGTFTHGVSGNWQLDTWYALAIVGRGDGTPLEFYAKPFTAGQTPPVFTTTTGTSGGTLITSPGTGPSANPVSIGQRQGGTQTSEWAFKNLMLFDNPLGANVAETAANLNLLAEFSADY